MIGAKYGNHVYKLPWVKKKTIEGSFGVGLGTTCAIVLAQVIFGAIFLPVATILGVVTTILIKQFLLLIVITYSCQQALLCSSCYFPTLIYSCKIEYLYTGLLERINVTSTFGMKVQWI
ncbi:MAG: hypothetical protein GWO20_03345 [Candidatus Korarchaeota archaeon]|nr:hypothetical protein [Candidatus Korarchaeota archaeon]NIU81909.1 hypothetical protein [Candidatus Thorarchaeota archaeon]NIW12367.1 hypothetical protein [Candidatus Thorarchaeota archaeon]NIW51159.1 hypothetical protein [Candidatus Korarchaeota archaeon]